VIRQVLIRLALAVVTLLAVSALIFFSISALPGNAATHFLGQNATPASLRILNHELGLDRPLLVRYVDWLTGFVRGDLGVSGISLTPVWQTISSPLEHTAILAVVTTMVLVPLAVLFGTLSAVLRDRPFDHATAAMTLLLISLPEFVVGNLLILLLGIKLKLFPAVSLFNPNASVFGQWNLLVLPALTLVAVVLGQSVRMVRATLLDVLESDFVQLARLSGVPESRVILRHALPNALAPVIQVLIFNVAWLLGGVVIVEVVFQYPGIGAALTSAISSADLPTVEAVGLLASAAFIVLNLIGDVIIILSNPRLRRA